MKRKLSKFIIFAVRLSDVKLLEGMNSDVYKMRKFKNGSNIIFAQLVKRKIAVG